MREKSEKVRLEAGLRNALADLLHALTSLPDEEEEKLEEKIYSIIKRNNLEAKEFFRACYTILVGKDHGPKLAQFILFAGKEKVTKLIEESI